jgi:hypothetical protein
MIMGHEFLLTPAMGREACTGQGEVPLSCLTHNEAEDGCAGCSKSYDVSCPYRPKPIAELPAYLRTGPLPLLHSVMLGRFGRLTCFPC